MNDSIASVINIDLMKDSTQRPSPSSPNLQADNHEGAGEGLDVTACSASSLWCWVKYSWSGDRTVDKILKIAIMVWIVNLLMHVALLIKVICNI